jgi:hypothetical protein
MKFAGYDHRVIAEVPTICTKYRKKNVGIEVIVARRYTLARFDE